MSFWPCASPRPRGRRRPRWRRKTWPRPRLRPACGNAPCRPVSLTYSSPPPWPHRRALVTRGESVWLVVDGTPYAAADWDITSRSVRPADWTYRVTLAGPSGTLTRTAPHAQVLHFRMRVDARWPWRGRSPWVVSAATMAIATALERSLRAEQDGPIGHVLPGARR